MSNQEKNYSDTQKILLEKFRAQAVIFDLDGTLIDNNEYHLKALRQYLKNEGREISDEEYNAHINGRTDEDVMDYLHGNTLSKEEKVNQTLEKAALYRKLYKAEIKPVAGLIPFLQLLKLRNIPMAIATSGIKPNIAFMFENIPIRQYFNTIIDSDDIENGKPNPEIYLKAAEALHIKPDGCLVFEDSVPGIESAKRAGMKVVAISTTHPRNELNDADFISPDFNFFNIKRTDK